MPAKPNAPAAQLNSEPILRVLRLEFANVSTVLEIGSGTGQHAVRFAAALPHLKWQPSDRAENQGAIHAWIDEAQLANLNSSIELDVLSWVLANQRYDAVFSANTAHIMAIDTVAAMFRVVAGALHAHGVFCLYGPFNEGGKFTSDSNKSFDQSLRAQDPQMGIRDIEELDGIAGRNEMRRIRSYAMPANNQLTVWKFSQQRCAEL